MRWQNSNSIVLILLLLFALVGCRPLMINNLSDRFRASNDRNWSPELSVLPLAEFVGDSVKVSNIRNNQYASKDDFVVNHYDKTIRVNDVQSVDFIVVPFKQSPALAHTMLSFGLKDGSQLGVSVEVRNEKEESYQPLLGVSNQYEVIYVVADEKDLIRLRTRHRDDSVYVYPTIANAKQAQELFVDVMQRVIQLAGQPEFYHSLANNCTTNLVRHVNNLQTERVPFSWKVLLPGFSARYAYDIGLLDNRIPFEDLESIAYVNDLAEQHFDDHDFSRKIRSKRYMIERAILRQTMRESTLTAGSGLEWLERNEPKKRTQVWR